MEAVSTQDPLLVPCAPGQLCLAGGFTSRAADLRLLGTFLQRALPVLCAPDFPVQNVGVFQWEKRPWSINLDWTHLERPAKGSWEPPEEQQQSSPGSGSLAGGAREQPSTGLVEELGSWRRAASSSDEGNGNGNRNGNRDVPNTSIKVGAGC